MMVLQIFSVIIHGPGSLDCEHSIKGPMTMGQIWDLMEVTPGTIAASAIFFSHDIQPCIRFDSCAGMFSLSSDVELLQQGKSTKINYEGNFNIYLKYLITVNPRTNLPSG